MVLKKMKAVKVNVVLWDEFENVKASERLHEYKYFATTNEVLNFYEVLKVLINRHINIKGFAPQLGSSYIELLAEIKQEKTCINAKNNENACFS